MVSSGCIRFLGILVSQFGVHFGRAIGEHEKRKWKLRYDAGSETF